jgi:hypothetical protein
MAMGYFQNTILLSQFLGESKSDLNLAKKFFYAKAA